MRPRLGCPISIIDRIGRSERSARQPKTRVIAKIDQTLWELRGATEMNADDVRYFTEITGIEVPQIQFEIGQTRFVETLFERTCP